jgi:hypothetical protein
MADKGDHPGYHLDPTDFYKDLNKDEKKPSGVDNKTKLDEKKDASVNKQINVEQDASKNSKNSHKEPKL